MGIRISVCVLCVLLGLEAASGTACARVPILLRCHPKQGAKRTYSNVDTLWVQMTENSMPLSMVMTVVSSVTSTVSVVRDDGNFFVDTKTSEAAMSMTIDMEGTHMESFAAAPDTTHDRGLSADDLKRQVRQLAGLRAVTEYAPSGKVVSTAIDTSSTTPKADLGLAKFTDNPLLVTFADHPVSEGDSWSTRDTDLDGQKRRITEGTYSLRSVGSTTAEITFERRITVRSPELTQEGTYSGTCTVDRATGLAIRSSAALTMQITPASSLGKQPSTVTGSFWGTSDAP